jgi:membrane protein DedA with SNARE-associated domain
VKRVFVEAGFVSPETLQALWSLVESIDPRVALGAIFILLVLAGCGLPLPEDIPLTFTGILLGLPHVQAEYGGLGPAVAVIGLLAYSSILVGDLVAYKLGTRYGRSLIRYAPFRWAVSERRMARLERWFRRFGNFTVFLGRMVAGIRFVTFLTAGMARMPLSTFVLFDSLAALVTVPAWIFLGYFLGTHFQDIVKWMGRIGTTTWIVVGALFAIGVLVWLLMRLRRKPPAEVKEF